MARMLRNIWLFRADCEALGGFLAVRSAHLWTTNSRNKTTLWNCWDFLANNCWSNAESGSIYKFPTLPLFCVFLLDQSYLDTIVAPPLNLSKYMEHNSHVIPQISLNWTKYISSWGSLRLRAVANLSTDGKWLQFMANPRTHLIFRVPTNKLWMGRAGW